MTRVTVVTPSLNQGQFIEETIRSVLLQCYPNLEYIVIDGGSTDGTTDIIKRYEPRIDSWVSEPDAGQTAAINKGFKRARGEIVAWLNSDDLFATRYAVSEAAAFLANHEEVSVVYGDSLIIDEIGRPLRHWKAPDFDLVDLLYDNQIPQMSAFIRRDALEAVGYLDEEFHHSMDYDLWLRLSPEFTISSFPSLWSMHRFHPNSKTMTQDEVRCRDNLRALSRFFTKESVKGELGVHEKAAIAKAELDLAIAEASTTPLEGIEAEFERIRKAEHRLFAKKEALRSLAWQIGRREDLSKAGMSLQKTFFRLAGWFDLPPHEVMRALLISHISAGGSRRTVSIQGLVYRFAWGLWRIWDLLRRGSRAAYYRVFPPR